MKQQGKNAIVTGAGSGMGNAAALHMATAGATVLCGDIAGAAETAAEIVRSGGTAEDVEISVALASA